ncbi:hypothetical protein JAAARDRAFT_27606 [Jaapia argillacea MUCL 33604]|uniref:F-box domain-containing protein n=1 Tax=Jaapia argillacea MUCL 33604 TaxID=933084 RepID=A0A067QMW1_9AGAM|nr:hypothetical protein JAAARDRAFT_27606 [Jaapia argillacea MUCL 33604]
MACASLLSLPDELTGEIIDAIPSPSDILSLALTCRSLEQLLIPSVLNYRHITLGVTKSLPLWLDLARSPGLARNVRHLEVDYATFFGEPEEPESETYAAFCRALRGMSGLLKFGCNYTDGTVTSMGLGGVLEAIRISCPHLNNLGLAVKLEDAVEDDWDAELPKFRNIETFYYYLELFPTVDYPSFGNVLRFLFNNPSLVSIQLHFHDGPQPLEDSIVSLHFPNLEMFTLTHVTFTSPAFCSFLRLNNSLVSLHLYSCSCLSPGTPMLDSLRVGDLPNLRNCWVDSDNSWMYVCEAKPPLLRSLGRVRAHHFSHQGKRAFEAIRAVSGSLELLRGSLGLQRRGYKEAVIAAFPSLEVVCSAQY